MRCVVDTIVWLSGLANASAAPGALVGRIIAGDVTPVFSRESFAELAEVLHRPRILRWLSLTGLEAIDFLDLVEEISEFVTPLNRLPVSVRDPKDRKILAVALGRPRAVALVTGDIDLLVLQGSVGINVLSPAAFVERYPVR